MTNRLLEGRPPLDKWPVRVDAAGRKFTEWVSCDPFWAIGSSQRSLVHRAIGLWPGNDAVRTACGNSLVLHRESGLWPDLPSGAGRAYSDIGEIPAAYRLCLRCVALDEGVE